MVVISELYSTIDYQVPYKKLGHKKAPEIGAF